MNPENAISFCRKWCEKLTPEQEKLIHFHVNRNTFFGVGRPVGRMIFCPLVSLHPEKWIPNVINYDGYYELSAVDGRRGYVETNFKGDNEK